MHHPNRRSQGFTLIELLVVIAIIAILAAILFPVFSTVRARARAINGLNDTKQMALAVQMYSNDFDSDFPLSGWSSQLRTDKGMNLGDGSPDQGTLQWSNVVGPFVRSGGLVTDTSDTSSGNGAAAPKNGLHSLIINDLLSHNPHATGIAPYGDNDWYGNKGPDIEVDQVGKGENTVTAPADCVLLMEGHCTWSGASGAKSYDGFQTKPGDYNKFLGENNISQYATINVTGTNYNGWHAYDGLPMHNQRTGTNAAFVDGHAKYFKVTDGNGNNTIATTLPFRKNIDPTQAGMGNGDWQTRGIGNGGAGADNWE